MDISRNLNFSFAREVFITKGFKVGTLSAFLPLNKCIKIFKQTSPSTVVLSVTILQTV